MKKFLRDSLDSFLLAAAVVAVTDIEALIQAGSKEQLVAAAVALGRAALIAGFAAIAPKLVARRDARASER